MWKHQGHGTNNTATLLSLYREGGEGQSRNAKEERGPELEFVLTPIPAEEDSSLPHLSAMSSDKTRIVVLHVDLGCYRCKKTIREVLATHQEEWDIKTITYDEKNKKVTLKGPFDPDKLVHKLCRKAGTVIRKWCIKKPEKLKAEHTKPSKPEPGKPRAQSKPEPGKSRADDTKQSKPGKSKEEDTKQSESTPEKSKPREKKSEPSAPTKEHPDPSEPSKEPTDTTTKMPTYYSYPCPYPYLYPYPYPLPNFCGGCQKNKPCSCGGSCCGCRPCACGCRGECSGPCRPPTYVGPCPNFVCEAESPVDSCISM